MKIKKPERQVLPLEEIPEGIRLCLENCNRLYLDGTTLFDKERYNGAISQFILAQEEFAKAILLFKHYKEGKPISKKKTDEYFGSHKLRLKEFQKFFFENLPDFDKKSIDKFAEMMSHSDKESREKHTYIDWTQLGWLTPNSAWMAPFENEIKSFAKSHTGFFKTNLKLMFSTILENPEFVKVIKLPKVDRPTGDKIQSILKKESNFDKITSSIEIGQFHIKVELTKNHPEITEELRNKVKKSLIERFPKYLIFVFLINRS